MNGQRVWVVWTCGGFAVAVVIGLISLRDAARHGEGGVANSGSNRAAVTTAVSTISAIAAPSAAEERGSHREDPAGAAQLTAPGPINPLLPAKPVPPAISGREGKEMVGGRRVPGGGGLVLPSGNFSPDGEFIEQEIVGIGAVLRPLPETGGLEISGVLPGSPAAGAGLSGFIIQTIDGVDVAGMSLADCVRRIRGPAGTTVQLGGTDASRVPRMIELVRDRVTLQSTFAPGTR